MSSIERIYQSVLRISHTLYVEETKNELDVILNDACEEIASLKKQLEDFSPEMTELRDACLLAQAQLAEREAECLKLRNVLKTVMANAPEPYCAITRAVDVQVREALSTPQSTTYLEQWEKERYEVTAFEWRVTYATGGYTRHLCNDKIETEGWNEATLTEGVVKPLYARKD